MRCYSLTFNASIIARKKAEISVALDVRCSGMIASIISTLNKAIKHFNTNIKYDKSVNLSTDMCRNLTV